MEELLFLAHRIPYPPNKGDKIRSWHLLEHLAARYRVSLGCFIDDPADWQYLDKLCALCQDVRAVPLEPSKARVRSLKALASRRALTQDYYRDDGLKAWADDFYRRNPNAPTLVFSSAMAQFAKAGGQGRKVIDFVDIDSDKWRQYAANKHWPMSWLYRREGYCLLQYERAIAAKFDASLFVSQAEAAMFEQLAPGCADRIGYFNNGVDADYFSPNRSYDNPYPEHAHAIVFTGAMDYWPNVDAVLWFAEQVFPKLRERHPQALFYVVGARPEVRVKALASHPGVVVTGMVPDVRPYLAHADIAVAPLRIARGIQNKVLEAMAMAKTVVVTPQALEGINAMPGKELLLVEDARQHVSVISAFLTHPDARLGLAARRKVENDYGWEANLARVDALLRPPGAQADASSTQAGATVTTP